ncbi:MAG TPA: hypothetical protein VI790_04770 [Candidatus Nanoarchaeia archaeon]|nr:hypothetical protein [Candidatus Nanoarchaeia archaeon]
MEYPIIENICSTLSEYKNIRYRFFLKTVWSMHDIIDTQIGIRPEISDTITKLTDCQRASGNITTLDCYISNGLNELNKLFCKHIASRKNKENMPKTLIDIINTAYNHNLSINKKLIHMGLAEHELFNDSQIIKCYEEHVTKKTITKILNIVEPFAWATLMTPFLPFNAYLTVLPIYALSIIAKSKLTKSDNHSKQIESILHDEDDETRNILYPFYVKSRNASLYWYNHLSRLINRKSLKYTEEEIKKFYSYFPKENKELLNSKEKSLYDNIKENLFSTITQEEYKKLPKQSIIDILANINNNPWIIETALLTKQVNIPVKRLKELIVEFYQKNSVNEIML